ncbi:SRPBCC family protein [Sphaerisporangium corydalis]|uniref:SRPBCC domain-containing protein n=1 Tax=Sphaerisporangium corydalis TaxID=1441875 RepID=A0ABV9EMU1_9ACTN|nr:SRPBCC domain-containing protein [Sphaerisporangium corydalis]
MTGTPFTPAVTAEYTITYVLDAPRDLVFAAWTDPARFAHWFGPHGYTTPMRGISMDLRPGGVWRALVVDRDGAEQLLDGVYREVDAPARLVFTTGDPGNTTGDLASVVTLTLTDVGGKTEMRFHQAGYNTDEAHARGSRAGWLEFFDRLAEHLARDPATG